MKLKLGEDFGEDWGMEGRGKKREGEVKED